MLKIIFLLVVSDYLFTPSVISLTSSQTSANIIFQIVDDNILEGPESFILMAQLLTADSSGITGDFVRQVDIIDNDGKLTKCCSPILCNVCYFRCLNWLCAKFIQCDGK